MREPNDLLRAARLRSASGPMSRQDLAKALNGVLFSLTGREYALDANYVGKLVRGVIGWPHSDYREALRTVLGAGTNAELGLYLRRGDENARNVAPDSGTENVASIQRQPTARTSTAMCATLAAVTVTATAGARQGRFLY